MVLLHLDSPSTKISTKIWKDIAQISLDLEAPDYERAEQQFSQLLVIENLDYRVTAQPALLQTFETALQTALATVYIDQLASCKLENQFLQRILYIINRLNFVWYKDLKEYANERSFYVHWVRERIENPWQEWELEQLDLSSEKLSIDEIKSSLVERGVADLEPPLSENKRYLRQDMSLESYRHLIAIASLDGLVESSRLCHLLGGASNEIQATLIRVLLEEYGNGRLNRKHSTFFAQMMTELYLDPTPEAYLDLVPWQVLASINHNFLMTQRKRNFLRYIGGFTYFEIVGPSIYQDYIRLVG